MYEGGFGLWSLGSGGISEAASLVVENPALYLAFFADCVYPPYLSRPCRGLA